VQHRLTEARLLLPPTLVLAPSVLRRRSDPHGRPGVSCPG
jgi:hypothetical protein